MSDTSVALPTREMNALAARLSELWSDERCVWKVEYEARFGGSDPTWICYVEWTQEFGNAHSADWCTYTWQFYGDSAHDALTGAVEWAEELAPLKPCGECDGNGSWNGVTCVDCGGSGLEAGGGR